MKNIHILPTENINNGYVIGKCIKGLSDVKVGELTKTYYLMFSREYFQPQNVYITSNEKPKNGEWILSLCDDESYETFWKCDEIDIENMVNFDLEFMKIILTTDQDLINDNIQAINDDFLDFIIKNPTIQFVETKCYSKYNDGDFSHYKIIIPKKENNIIDEWLDRNDTEAIKNKFG